MLINDRYLEQVHKIRETITGLDALCGKTVMITGASGMICSSIVHILIHLNRTEDAGIRLLLCGRSRERMQRQFSPFKEGEDYIFCIYDALKPLEIEEKADYVIFGAGNADPAHIGAMPVETILSNVTGLEQMLRYCTRSAVKRLLFISSSEVYGRMEGAQAYREDQYGYVDLLNPRASYPNSKRLAETLCVSYRQEYGADIVIVRPGHIYGPTILKTDSRASAQFTRLAKQGKDIVLKSAGTQKRSYVYTLDCASAILTVLLRGRSGEAYNIANPEAEVSIRELAQLFARFGKVNVISQQESRDEAARGNLMDRSILDAARLMGLGWRPLFSIEDGVRNTLRYYEE